MVMRTGAEDCFRPRPNLSRTVFVISLAAIRKNRPGHIWSLLLRGVHSTENHLTSVRFLLFNPTMHKVGAKKIHPHRGITSQSLREHPYWSLPDLQFLLSTLGNHHELALQCIHVL